MTDLAERMVGRAGRAVAVMMDEESTELAVHPAAAVFPMLADDELRDLAEDIKQNGLHHPIVLDSIGQIVDGRNRSAACTLAGVAPSFISLPPETDVLAYILSENVRRRHMTKGQQAMAIALMIETPEGKRDGAAKRLTLDSSLSRQYVGLALTIRRHAPELAAVVLAGAEPFDTAYATARSRKDAASSVGAQMAALRAEAPDLADLVVEERVTLREALALRDKRRADARRQRESATAGLLSAVRFLAPPSGDIAEHAERLVRSLDASLVTGAESITPESIARSIAFLEVVHCGLAGGGMSHGRSEAESVPS